MFIWVGLQKISEYERQEVFNNIDHKTCDVLCPVLNNRKRNEKSLSSPSLPNGELVQCPKYSQSFFAVVKTTVLAKSEFEDFQTFKIV